MQEMERFRMPKSSGSARWLDRLLKNINNDREQSHQADAECRRRSAEAVRQNITGLAECLTGSEGFLRGQLMNRWFEILGSGIGANACPRYIKNRILYITCSSPIWSQEIALQQSTILERFNACLPPEQHLKKIVCKVGNISLPKFSHKNSIKLPPAELTEEEIRRVKLIQAESSDPKLAALLAKAYAQNLLHNRQLLALGAVHCEKCRHISFTGSPCLECRRELKEEERLQVLRLLDSCPWYNYSAVKQVFPRLEQSDFIAYRLALASSWRENISRYIESLPDGTALPEDLQASMVKLVALEMSKPYAEITEGDVKMALARRSKNGKIFSHAYSRSLLENKVTKTSGQQDSR